MTWLIRAIVVDDATRSMLVDAAGLPGLELPKGDPATERVVDALEAFLGRSITPVWFHYQESEGDRESGIGLALTPADPARDATAGRTFTPAEDIVETIEPELARAPIRAWLDRLDGRTEPNTPPWMTPGWFERVSAWIADRMTAAGLPPSGPSRMTYQSPIGSVLRTRSGERTTFLKASAPHFRAEASIVRALAARTPGWVPDVIDVEPTEGWLLMADLDGRVLGDEPEAAWPDGIRRVGEVQRAWVGHLDELVAIGGQQRPLTDLIAAVPGLLDVDGLADRIAPELRERWPATLPRFVDACRELDAIGLPDALVHGDMHPWNVAVTDRGPVVFDWSDGAAGPPFVDLAVYLRRTKDLELRRVLRDTYLDAWSDLAPRDRLERAAELAMTVGALYQVVTYQALLPALPPWDRLTYAGADVSWFRHAMDGIERGLDSIGLPPDDREG